MYDWERSAKRRNNSAGRNVFAILAAVAIVAAAVVGFLSRSSADGSPIQLLRENLHLGIATTQNVSENSSKYLQAVTTVSTQFEYVMNSAYDELNVTWENCYESNAGAIRELLDCISALDDLHIASGSPLAEYETFCADYYGHIADSFTDIRQNGVFAWEEYRALVEWMDEREKPYDKLKELFDANGITYKIKYQSDGTEYMEYDVSALGAH